jgi:hypothetical protein
MPQNIIPHDMTEWTVEKYAIINDLKDKNDFKALITYDALFSLGINWSIWLCHDKLLSITIPRNFVLCIFEI